ncbi:hypothetical protein DFP72DRAFT_1058957 [Ephemerocybe angulata]|uniref:Uncharacterized protein n=1 Tax=Ephemerocybe angulata TaxID=980116 RepID=A0A8H6ME25_9AGAR|nr:hypothetical protein DFP72DRAFT_1058957 [Tulosesus angulatus]
MAGLNNVPRTVMAGGPFGVYPGVANPNPSNAIDSTARDNPDFVCALDYIAPLDVSLSKSLQAAAQDTGRFRPGGAGTEFREQLSAQRVYNESPGVIEHHPGIIESSNIDPLNENSNKDDGWANSTSGPGGSRNVTEKKPTNFAAGAMKLAYGTLAGNEQKKEEGREAMHGTK